MPIFRPHPDVEGAYYLKRLPSEPRFEARLGVSVTVTLDRQYVSGTGTGTTTLVATIEAKDALETAIAPGDVAVTFSPVTAEVSPGVPQLSAGTVVADSNDGGLYRFTCVITVNLQEDPDGALLSQRVVATVTGGEGRTGRGSDAFFLSTERPASVTDLVATPWVRGVRLTWNAEQTYSPVAVLNSYLFRKPITGGDPNPTLSRAEVIAAIGSANNEAESATLRLYRVQGNSHFDQEDDYTTTFRYWIVSVDLFGNVSDSPWPSDDASPGQIVTDDLAEGAIDIATIAAENSVPNALAAGTVTTTKLGVLNAAFDPNKFTGNSTDTVSWTGVTIVRGAAGAPATVFSPPNGSTTGEVLFWDSSANAIVGRARWNKTTDPLSPPANSFESTPVNGGFDPDEDLLLGFNKAGVFIPSFTGTVISGDLIQTNAIEANKINVTALSALSANLGQITAGVVFDNATTPRNAIRFAQSALPIVQNALGQPLPSGASGNAVIGNLIDLAATNTSGAGANNRRLISFAKRIGTTTPEVWEDLFYIDASGKVRMAGEVNASVLAVGYTDSEFTQLLASPNRPALSVKGESVLDGLSADEVNTLALVTQLGTASEFKVEKTLNAATFVSIGSYNFAPEGTPVLFTSNTGTGASNVTTTTDGVVVASTSVALSTLDGESNIQKPYDNAYTVTVVPKIETPTVIDSGTSLPSTLTTTILIERLTPPSATWELVTSRTFSVSPYGPQYSYGSPPDEDPYVSQWDIGVAPGVTSDAGTSTILPAVRSIAGAGTVSVTTTNATFSETQSFSPGDWFRAYYTTMGGSLQPLLFQVVSGSGTTYTVSYTQISVTSSAFETFAYDTVFTVPQPDFDPGNPPQLRARIQASTGYDRGWDITTAPESMADASVFYEIDSAKNEFRYQTDAQTIPRQDSLAIVGGFLYLHPKADVPASGLPGEVIMVYTEDPGVVAPRYHNGVSWVPFGAGTGGSITVNTYEDVSSLTFTGSGVSLSGGAGAVTVTIDIGGSAVESIGGVNGAITLGANLTMSGQQLTLGSGVLTSGNYTTYAPSLTGLNATGSWNINAATVTNGVYTTGSYSNPAWITALAGSKITGDMSVGVVSLTGLLLTPPAGSLPAGADPTRIGGNVTVGGDITANGTIYANDFVLLGGIGGGSGLSLNNLDDVTIAGASPGVALANGQVLVYDQSSGVWRNVAPNFGSEITVQEEGVVQTTAATTLNFTGTNVTASAAGGVVTVNVSGAPSAHTHPIADITGLQAALDGKAALSHTHIIADVTGLQAALDGKASSTHTHTIADTTGLQTALDGKVATTTAVTASTGLTGGGALSSSVSLALTGQALSLHNMATTGLFTRTSGGSITARSIAVSGGALSVSNANGSSGNPTITFTQTNITALGTLTSLKVETGAYLAPSPVDADDLTLLGGNLRVGGTVYANDFVLTGGVGGGTGLSLNNLDDVTIAGAVPGVALADGQLLQYDAGSGVWRNKTVATALSVQSGGTAVGTRSALNFVQGSNVTLSVVDDGANGRVNVTVSATGNVASVFGRAGAVVAQSGDYSLSQIGGVTISGTPSDRFLRHSGTAWVDALLTVADIPTLTAAKISDFNTAVRTNRLDQMAAPTAAVSFNGQSVTGVASLTVTGTVTAATFSGGLSGNATTATTLQAARTINGTSFNGSANITTATWGTSRTITLGATGKSVNGSGNVSWTLTEIGATTVGGNLFSLANPSAIRFLRVNADNTVSALDAASFRAAIGAGTSSTVGTVTSVGGTGTVNGLTLSGTVTTSGNLTLGGSIAIAGSQVTSGTVADARLSANVPLLNTATDFTNTLRYLGYVPTDLDTHNTSAARQVAAFTTGFQPLNRPAVGNYFSGFSFRHNLSGTYVTQVSFAATDSSPFTYRYFNNVSWSAWRVVLSDQNYNSYAPTLTGTGASGTWGISITGTATTSNNLRSNATTGVMQVVGPGAGATRVMTIPNANFTAARTDAAQTFSGTQTFSGAISGTTLTMSGNATAADFILGSDRRLKRDFQELTGSLESLDRIKAYRYWQIEKGRVEVGLIAQEVQTILPEAVTAREDGMLGIAYDRVVPLLVAAIKDLRARVIELEGAR